MSRQTLHRRWHHGRLIKSDPLLYSKPNPVAKLEMVCVSWAFVATASQGVRLAMWQCPCIALLWEQDDELLLLAPVRAPVSLMMEKHYYPKQIHSMTTSLLASRATVRQLMKIFRLPIIPEWWNGSEIWSSRLVLHTSPRSRKKSQFFGKPGDALN